MSEFLAALRTQGRVLHALLLRDLGSRHGGKLGETLWLLGEPIALFIVVMLLHTVYGPRAGQQSSVVPIGFILLTGYLPHYIFRRGGQLGRTAIRAGRQLRNHYHINYIDLVLARFTVETTTIIVAAILLYFACYALGAVGPPKQMSWVYLGAAIDLWFILDMTLLLAALTTMADIVDHLFRPISLLMLVPFLSFMMMAWFPPEVRAVLVYLPPSSAAEVMRYGYIGDAYPTYFNIPAASAACLALTFLALACLRIARARER